jgi:multisubunit Na+/H+ antiporter MnhB subunit
LRKTATIISLAIVTALLIASALLMHPFGQPPSEMDDYIIDNAQTETGANNVVCSVVFDYRGYDTLGEATILFTAVTAVVMLFRRSKEETIA